LLNPPENYKLYKRIEEEGTIISEFPIGTKPSKYTFPQRNINNPYGEGNNKLLKEGAYPLTSSKDIYNQIPYLEKRKIYNLEIELEISDLEKKVLELTYEPVHIDYLVQNTRYSFT